MGVAGRVPLNSPAVRGGETAYIAEVLGGAHFAGAGPFAGRVEESLRTMFGASSVLLTHSCTAALEMAALLTVEAGDEVILPSFTFPTTASAFARCGARLVFADILEDTLTIDPDATGAAVTPRTRVIVPVHYAGVARDLDEIGRIARSANAHLIEDAAHAFGASFAGRPLGTFGELAAFSFHQTKNVMSGEGGALVVNDESLADRARTIRDHGTDRARFDRGDVAAYSWQELGSAYAPAEIVAAFLLAQIEQAETITATRRRQWSRYHEAFADLEKTGRVRRPKIPDGSEHNGHIYYLIAADRSLRDSTLAALDRQNIEGASHYVPLHHSPAGRRYGQGAVDLPVTDRIARCMLRLPLHAALGDGDLDRIVSIVDEAVRA